MSTARALVGDDRAEVARRWPRRRAPSATGGPRRHDSGEPSSPTTIERGQCSTSRGRAGDRTEQGASWSMWVATEPERDADGRLRPWVPTHDEPACCRSSSRSRQSTRVAAQQARDVPRASGSAASRPRSSAARASSASCVETAAIWKPACTAIFVFSTETRVRRPSGARRARRAGRRACRPPSRRRRRRRCRRCLSRSHAARRTGCRHRWPPRKQLRETRSYQVFVRARCSGRLTRTRASTATQPSGSASTGLRSSSATAGRSSPRRASRRTRSASASASAGGAPRKPATSRPALPLVTSSAASVSVSGAIRNAASPISSAKTPPGPERDQRPEHGILHDPGEQLRAAADHLLHEHGRADPLDGRRAPQPRRGGRARSRPARSCALRARRS